MWYNLLYLQMILHRWPLDWLELLQKDSVLNNESHWTVKQQLTAVPNMTLLCRQPRRPESQTRGASSYVMNSDSVLSSVSLDNHVFSLVALCIHFPVFSCIWSRALRLFIDVVLHASSSHASPSFVETVDKHKHPVLHLLWCQSKESHRSLKPVYGRRTWWPC